MEVDEVLERMRRAFGLSDLSLLAERLNMDETTFRVWRTRRSVPSKILVTCSTETGTPVNWLRDGGVASPPPTEPSQKIFVSKAKQVNQHLGLNREELALLENYRAATAEGRVAIEAASAALAQQAMKRKKAA